MRMLKTTLNCWKALAMLPAFLILSLATSFGQTVTYSSASAVQAIPDGGYNGTFASMATKTASVSNPAGLLIGGIRVKVNNLNHTWTGDLTMKLQGPGGQIFGLQSRAGLAEGGDGAGFCCGSSSDLINASITYTDAGAVSAENMGAAGNVSGTTATFSPAKGAIVSPFTSFATLAASFANSQAANGTWTLGIGDGSLSDAGNYASFSIEFDLVQPCALNCP